MNRFKSIALVLAGTVVASVSFIATANETIKIGVSQPLTGAVAASGNYVTQGAQIAESFINDAGGVLGKKIEQLCHQNILPLQPFQRFDSAPKLLRFSCCFLLIM